MASSPRILNKPTDSHPTRHEAMQKARLAVHRRSACSGVKALRNTSAARRHAAKALLPFRSLAPFRALREPNRRRRDEERLSRSEQRTDDKPKTPLDRKSKHPPRTAEGHSPRPPIWPTRHDPIPRACGEGPGWGFDARSLLLRSDLAQAVDDAALRRQRVFREARP